MAFKVLIVDDSSFYRRRVRDILNADRDLEVVGEAANGQEAIDMISRFNPDVVTMDVEMPVMDGISAVKAIMQRRPLPIMMFSSLTHQGAQATLDALEAGALDFLPKKFEDIAGERQEAAAILRTKVRLLARRGGGFRRAAMPAARGDAISMPRNAPKSAFIRSSSVLSGQANAPAAPVPAPVTSVTRSGKSYRCLAVGASTGGPVALQKLLMPLPADFAHPIILVQHMPGTFTQAFAQRLNSQCKIQVQEASDGDVLKAGHAYLAPGGKQLRVVSRQGQAVVQISESNEDNFTYKPSVDVTFASLTQCYGGDVLGLILTGMGADGRDGCQTLRERGATIWAQDQASCVVYGMPQAVAKANLAHKSIGIDHMSACVQTEMATG